MPTASPLLAETVLYRFGLSLMATDLSSVHFHGGLLNIGCVIDAGAEPESAGRDVRIAGRRQEDKFHLPLTRPG
ncbi:uncharacterized protein N7496_006314 [Penicillium cataractarum]|uniref:Uncharacterized protein n=1 Tax=Penicillium cataractarum TaxID=2100454 RepID=A0A9W9S1A3_9EURO|nr:uncharacterized protein N7496_006314 [Penicillium cataractarum]KAJ5370222.1 hypothetical protein N7496_006314 [Penicillium cataractarum]